MRKQSLLIIGAGATGLMAARELCKDFEITILEARDRIGGRINSISTHGHIIEAGAEFIHGNLPVTLGLLKMQGSVMFGLKVKCFANNMELSGNKTKCW